MALEKPIVTTAMDECKKYKSIFIANNKEEFIEEFRRIIEAVADSPVICGYCYTQLTDVEQEANGLLTQEHNHKFSPDKIREIQNIAGR